ncbi:hypothetical protein RJ55_08041 [Drechmeria coniospora]|nr:hypothetical protein RJ55_08041 [Drechmeria coniospora]
MEDDRIGNNEGNGAPTQRVPESNNKDKGKGKLPTNEPSIVDRLHASGRMAWKSISSENLMPSTGQKTADEFGTGNIAQKLVVASSSSSHPEQVSICVRDSVKSTIHAQDRSEAYESFINDSPSHPVYTEGHGEGQTTFAKQEAIDGTNVVELLSLHDDRVELDEGGDRLSPAEATRLGEALFGRSIPNNRATWDQMLNFDPGFTTTSKCSSAEVQQYMGAKDRAAAQQVWLRQWSQVLSAYTNEVWGDVSHLVAEAKHEVSQLSTAEQQDSGETKALRRLRLILAHVRRHVHKSPTL